jgi:hypothetical protein
MEKIIIRVRSGQSVKTPLRTLEVGRATSLDLVVIGVPEGIQRLMFHVGRIGRDDFYPVEASALPDNRWSVYASGLHFQDVGKTAYHISAVDSRDNAVWLGKGRLEIVQSVLPVALGEIALIPEDSYVRNPETGLYHKLTCKFEDGMILPMIEEKGISR